MTDDRHSPTTAGPAPEPPPTATAAGAVVAAPPQGPTGGEGTGELPFGIPPDRPEILVGAAFAGGVLAAMILKRLGGG